MTELRDRLRAGDPARAARPLDENELAAMRRAMQAETVRPDRRFRVFAAALAMVATALVVAVLLRPGSPPPTKPVLPPVSVVQPAPAMPVAPPPPVVAEVRQPRRHRVRPPASAPAEPAQVKEIRFVTASGTQILWTFRSSEEGA